MENCKKPPPFSTLKTSASTVSTSGMSMRLIKGTAKSKLASSKGSSAAPAPVPDAQRVGLFRLRRVPDKVLGDVYAYHTGAAPGHETGIVSLAAPEV